MATLNTSQQLAAIGGVMTPEVGPTVPVAAFARHGTRVDTVPVDLSYGIIERFSEGLYSSPNKAFEELVSNSYDAGAEKVWVALPSDLDAEDARIVVVDNGESMNLAGLRDLWKIGESRKRQDMHASAGREPIGKFGIGKLSTYVLAHELTYLTCKDSEYLAVTMDYRSTASTSVTDSVKLALEVCSLAEDEALAVVEQSIGLTGNDPSSCLAEIRSSPSWTAAILTSLRETAREIKFGRLRWILETSLPLNPKFSLWYNETLLESSKLSGKKTWEFVSGHSESELTQNPDRPWGPALVSYKETVAATTTTDQINELLVRNENAPEQRSKRRPARVREYTASVKVPAIRLPKAGRVWGHAVLFEKPLDRGKSEDRGRSHGFFVRVRGRLINLDDDDFNIGPELRHGTLTRFHMEVNADDLDEQVASSREALKESTALEELKNYLLAIFNRARSFANSSDESDPIKLIAKDGRVAPAPASLSQAPLRRAMRRALDGDTDLAALINLTESNREFFEAIDETHEEIIQKVDLAALGFDAGYFQYDPAERSIVLNQTHPFVANYVDAKKITDPVKVMAVADFASIGYFLDARVSSEVIRAVTDRKDSFLRALIKRNPVSAVIVARNLRDATTDEKALEDAVADALEFIGFGVWRNGGAKHGTDGVATARLGRRSGQATSSYAFTYDAKSTASKARSVLDVEGLERQQPGAIRADTARSSILRVHREDLVKEDKLLINPSFTVLVAPGFQGAEDDAALIGKVCVNDEIVPLRVDDLARLVVMSATRGVTPLTLIELWQLRDVARVSEWIAALESGPPPARSPFRAMIKVLKENSEKATPTRPTNISAYMSAEGFDLDDAEVSRLVTTLSKLAPNTVYADEMVVALNSSVDSVYAEIRATLDGLAEMNDSAGRALLDYTSPNAGEDEGGV